MNVELIQTSRLRSYKHNINELPATKIAQLQESIRDEGLIEPLIVSPNKDGTFTVVDGNHRLLACQNLGLQELPCIVKASENLFRFCVHVNQFRGQTNLDKLIGIISDRLESGESVESISKDLGMKPWWVLTHYNMRNCKMAVKDGLETDVVCVPAFLPRTYVEQVAEQIHEEREGKFSYTTVGHVDYGLFFGNIIANSLESGINTDTMMQIGDEVLRAHGLRDKNELVERQKEYDAMMRKISSTRRATEALQASYLEAISTLLELEDNELYEITKNHVMVARIRDYIGRKFKAAARRREAAGSGITASTPNNLNQEGEADNNG